MLSLMGALLGFGSSLLPHLLKFWQDKRDKEHELKILELQLESQRQGHVQRIEEINAQADIEESKALYQAAQPIQIQVTGNKWLDGVSVLLTTIANFYNSSVRPTVTYGFTALYAWVKVAMFRASNGNILAVWSDPDMAIFCTIIGHWFGHRTLGKFFGKGGR